MTKEQNVDSARLSVFVLARVTKEGYSGYRLNKPQK
jgi:hypothetical protein